MSTITNLGPANAIPGKVINASGNVEAAMFMVMDYLQSTYNLQAADAQLEESISNAEAEQVAIFEETQNGYGGLNPQNPNYIYQLEHLTSDDPNYSQDVSILTTLYSNANAQNQATVKIMDGNNSTAQNTMSQNSQGQQGLMQTMSSINSIEANLARLIQG